MVMVMGLWNFLLRGSTVTMGLKVALFPRTALTRSSGTGWAWNTNRKRARVCLLMKLSVKLCLNWKIYSPNWVERINK